MKYSPEILKQALDDLQKAGGMLRHSYDKCRKTEIDKGLDYDALESFEALTSRFARLADIIIQKIFRLIDGLDLEDEAGIRDRINRADKKGLINDADTFIEIRILRNEISHDYKSETVYEIFERVMLYSPVLLESIDSIVDYSYRFFK